jgi:hypothetical protein
VANVKPDVERVLRMAHKVAEDGRSFDVQSTSAGIVVSNISRDEMLRAEDSAPTTLEALQERLSYPPVKSNDGGWTMDAGAEYYVPTVKRTTDPVFVFPDKDYPSYTDVRRLVALSGFEAISLADAAVTLDHADTLIYLSPEQPYDIGANADRQIWWTLEYGGEYAPDLTDWRGEVWACDPTWAQVHGAKLVVMGSHPELADTYRSAVEKPYDFLMLAYMTERRQRLIRQLADLKSPAEAYPGYMMGRTEQLIQSKLMLHAHQRDDTPAIAPQRFALCAAYKLPLIHEAVPDTGEYDIYAHFAEYSGLEKMTRWMLYNNRELPKVGEFLYQQLCVEQPFRKSVEDALK